MPLDARLGALRNLIKWAVAILAFFPGLAVYLSLVEVPPDFVGAAQIISVSVSILVIVCIPLFSDRLARIRKRWVAGAALALVLVGAGGLIYYTRFAKSQIVIDRWTGVPVAKEADLPRRIMPLNPPAGDIANTIAPYEGRHPKESYELALEGLSREDADLLRTRMAEESMGSFSLMVFLLLLSQVLLVAPPVALAWRLITEEEPAPAPGSAKTPPPDPEAGEEEPPPDQG